MLTRAESYAALAWRPEGTVDWAGGGGLAVALQSEREWRVALRLWTLDADGAERTWEHVVPASPQGVSVAAPWTRFRRVDLPGAPLEVGVPAAELGRVRGVALVVTPQLMRPGTEVRLDVSVLGRFGASR